MSPMRVRPLGGAPGCLIMIAVSIGLSILRSSGDDEPHGEDVPEGLEAIEASPPSPER